MQGLIWGAAAVTFLSLVLRAIVRLKVFRRLFADDAFVLLSWLLFLANIILYQKMTDTNYLIIDVYAGLKAPPADFLQRALDFLHEELAVNLLFLFSIWSIKLSFLLFFKKLGFQVDNQNILWWVVFCVTLAGLAICVGTNEFCCMTTDSIAAIPSKSTTLIYSALLT